MLNKEFNKHKLNILIIIITLLLFCFHAGKTGLIGKKAECDIPKVLLFVLLFIPFLSERVAVETCNLTEAEHFHVSRSCWNVVLSSGFGIKQSLIIFLNSNGISDVI